MVTLKQVRLHLQSEPNRSLAHHLPIMQISFCIIPRLWITQQELLKYPISDYENVDSSGTNYISGSVGASNG